MHVSGLGILSLLMQAGEVINHTDVRGHTGETLKMFYQRQVGAQSTQKHPSVMGEEGQI